MAQMRKLGWNCRTKRRNRETIVYLGDGNALLGIQLQSTRNKSSAGGSAQIPAQGQPAGPCQVPVRSASEWITDYPRRMPEYLASAVAAAIAKRAVLCERSGDATRGVRPSPQDPDSAPSPYSGGARSG